MPRALSSYLSAMDKMIATDAKRWVQQSQLTWYPEIRDLTLDIACRLLGAMIKPATVDWLILL